MEIVSTLVASLPTLISVGVLVFFLQLIREQRQLNHDRATHLKERLDGVEKERDEALKKITFSRPQEMQTLAPPKASDKKRLFISTPVRGFDDAELTTFVEQLSRMIDALRSTERFAEIFYENHNLLSKTEFDAKQLTTSEYVSKIKEAHVFVAIVPMPSISSVYFEAGYAAALGINSLYFVPEDAGKVMPSLMADMQLLNDNIRIVSFDSLNHIHRVLLERFG